MKTLRNHLRIMFSQIQPELLNILRKSNDSRLSVSSTNVNALAYHHCAGPLLDNLTYEEIDVLYEDMLSIMKRRGERCGGASVFALLPEYTLRVLDIYENEPVCRQDQLLNWRCCYLYLGQDILTTAHMAYVNTQNFKELRQFTWPAQIRTDDRRLDEILKKGLAENHFHLNGSTRSFDLSWICLMNHPSRISEFFDIKKLKTREKVTDSDFIDCFQENLNSSVSLGINDNKLDWIKRLETACWIRAKLLLWLHFDDERAAARDPDVNSVRLMLNFTRNLFSTTPLSSVVESARFYLGSMHSLIDYAITPEALPANEVDNCCRSLAGERAFLYNSFKYIYSGGNGNGNEMQMKRFMDLFYLYLLIKCQFRSEMIQVNQKYGFKNFALYQNRKDKIFEKFPVYALEAKNLSVVESMKNGNVRSLEMRIAPKDREDEMIKKIVQTDREIKSLMRSANAAGTGSRAETEDYFYVLHFPKYPDDIRHESREPGCWAANARNQSVRTATENQAIAIAKSLETAPYLCKRIRGIDACNFEIGCRPEVFATAFRFLRDFGISGHQKHLLYAKSLQPRLSATYHAGEDFMDLIDGLRAIDEAVLFLEMTTGERIGHAMALGVSAPDYYALKNNKVVLRKQDHLDNIVWALNKSSQTGIYNDSILTKQLEEKAQQLIYYIYGTGFSLIDYYNSWRLRGDDPELYRYGYYDRDSYSKPLMNYMYGANYWYNRHRIMNYESDGLDSVRDDSNAAMLYSMYHFSSSVRTRGNETEEVRITGQYVSMVTALQEKMMGELAHRHIGIEANPSSNVLIGPFEKYSQHPVFRFCPVVPSASGTVQFVSVNTDDQGVFDTSLAMEYSFLACALRSMKNDNNEQMYSDDAIYDYLERLRENGFSQAFNY